MNTYQPSFIGPPGADIVFACRATFWRASAVPRQIWQSSASERADKPLDSVGTIDVMTAQRVIDDKLVNFASHIDDNTIEQARQTASMPFVHPHIALMPDAHSGKGSAVGTVIPTVDAVIPAAVGVDIGCGMIAARTEFTAAALAGRDLAALRKAIETAIPLSPGNYNDTLARFPFTHGRIADLEHLAKDGDIELSHSPKWREQLGSLGGGNHFIELCLDQADRVWLFLHSGSRGWETRSRRSTSASRRSS